ncbi:MAG: PAS domain-containing sensor histidine kinase [Reichenbachiella sp.]|uniref:PAS domain-containing sensor histidine kinase n=1 Tax=Reichenbachiella sp. TaxID=2184521 RepID=UPI0032669319
MTKGKSNNSKKSFKRSRGSDIALSLQNHEQIFNSMLDPVVIYEIDEQINFVRMLDANSAFLRVYGLEREELDGLNFKMISAESDRVPKFIHEIGTKGQYLFETVHKTTSGRSFPVEVHSRRIKISQSNAIISIIRDISVRKNDKERLLALNQSKDNILKVVSHDLRSPLAQIQGILQLIQAEELPEPLKQYLTLLDESREHAEHIVADLLATDDLDNTEEYLKLRNLSVNNFCKKIIKHYEIVAKSKKRIKLRHQLLEKDGHISADEQKLIRVFDNLISNAVKFSFVDTEIDFEVALMNEVVQFSVKDYGIGIPDELQEFIFDQHTKAKRPGTQGEKTIGLGMFISKSIVEMHGGKIWFESTQDNGTIFHVSLPLT